VDWWKVLTGETAPTYKFRQNRSQTEALRRKEMDMAESALIFLGLVILAIVNFLGFRQLIKTLQEKKG